MGIAIDPEVRGGQPCIDGTREPYDVIAALTLDGLDAEPFVALLVHLLPAHEITRVRASGWSGKKDIPL